MPEWLFLAFFPYKTRCIVIRKYITISCIKRYLKTRLKVFKWVTFQCRNDFFVFSSYKTRCIVIRRYITISRIKKDLKTLLIHWIFKNTKKKDFSSVKWSNIMLCFLSVTIVLCYPYKTRRQWCLLYLFLNSHCCFDKNGFMEFDVWQNNKHFLHIFDIIREISCQSVVFLHVALFNRSYQKNIFDKRCVIKHLLKHIW